MKSIINASYETEDKGLRSKAPGRMFKSVPAGPKLAVCVGCSFCAFIARTPFSLGVLLCVNILLYIMFRTRPVRLKREFKVFCWQTVFIVSLYGFRFGLKEGLLPGLMTSAQLFLAFFPGMIFIQTTPQSRIIKAFSKVMSSRSAFVMTMSLRFIPLMIRDMKAIYEAQVFRGARILPKDLVNPLNWKDMLHCLVFPVTVHCMVMANEIALAAKSRDFMKYDQRTIWPGN